MSEAMRAIDSSVRARIASRDARHLDPVERAELVNEFIFKALRLEDNDGITNPLYWDLLSYCVQMYLRYAVQVDDEILQKISAQINSDFMSKHYSVPDDHAILGPERETHKQLWKDRIELVTEVE